MKNKLIKGTPEWEQHWRPIIEKRKKTCIEKYGYFTTFSNPQTQTKVKETMLRKYGVDNIFKDPEKQKEMLKHKLEKHNYDLSDVYDKIKETVQERYGVDNISQVPEIKEKKKQVCLERYGVDNVFKSPEIKAKIQDTNLHKYGVLFSSQASVVKQKAKETNLSRYGYMFTSQVSEIRRKIEETLMTNGGIGNANPSTLDKYKNTSLDKYGYEFATQSDEIKEKIKITCTKRYGVDWYCLSKDCKLKGNNSKENVSFEKLLQNNNIEYEREFHLSGRAYDFKIGEYLIEINPWWTHNSTIKNQWGDAKDKYYHFNKSKLAYDNGYMCIHIFDWMDKNLILTHIKDHSLYLSDFREIKGYAYNVKTKNVVQTSTLNENEVLLYDGGQDILW